MSVNMTDVEKAMDAFLEDTALAFLFDAQDKIVQNGSIASGHLVDSAKPIFAPLSKTVLFDTPYSDIVEFGSQPHMPPVDPLIQWAMLKFGQDREEATKTAWAVAKSIEQVGTEPHPFVRPTLDRLLYGGKKVD